jgi:hypothetical protein
LTFPSLRFAPWSFPPQRQRQRSSMACSQFQARMADKALCDFIGPHLSMLVENFYTDQAVGDSPLRCALDARFAARLARGFSLR